MKTLLALAAAAAVLASTGCCWPLHEHGRRHDSWSDRSRQAPPVRPPPAERDRYRR
jgi:hypothetical protein